MPRRITQQHTPSLDAKAADEMKFPPPTVVFKLSSRVNEYTAALIVVALLKEIPDRRIPFKDLWLLLSIRVNFCADDLEMSYSRKGEPRWCMAFRNIKAHKDVPGNAIYDGLLRDIPGGLALGNKKPLTAPMLWDFEQQ